MVSAPPSDPSIAQSPDSLDELKNAYQEQPKQKLERAPVPVTSSSVQIDQIVTPSYTSIEHAIRGLDFTALHSEALSSKYMQTPTSTHSTPDNPFTSTDLSQTLQASDESESPRPFNPTLAGNLTAQSRTHAIEEHFPLLLTPMFDPLWCPKETKEAATAGYLVDLKKGMFNNC